MQKWILILLVGVANLVRSAEIRYVFKPAAKGDHQELIRLYTDNTYEYLVYTPVSGDMQRKAVKQTKGKYSLAAGKLKLHLSMDQKQQALFNRTLYIDNNYVYERSLYARLNKKKYLLRSVNKLKFGQPFYLEPGTHKFVALTAQQRKEVSIQELVSAIAEPGSTGMEKVKRIVDFLRENTQVVKRDELSETNDVLSCLSDPQSEVSNYVYANLFSQLLTGGGIQNLVIQGDVKNSDGTFKAHQWNAVTIGNNVTLMDVSQGKEWCSVAPELLIYSHFPVREENQFLPTPLSRQAFESSILIEPLSENASFVEILPSSSWVTVGREMTMIVKNASQPLTVTEVNGAMRNPITVTTKQTKGCSIVRWKVGTACTQFQVKLGSVLKWTYQVVKGDAENEEVNDFLSANFTAPIPVLPSPTNAVVKPTVGLELAQWNESFLSDLVAFQFPMNANLNHPLIKKAAGFYNLKEIPGEVNQKQIVQFFHATGNKQIKTDEDPWCSAFIAFCAKELGYSFSSKTAARSWLNVGKSVDAPKSGDIVIFWREDPNSWKGHVAIYLGTNEQTKEILCLGGNQGDKVCIQAYCMDHVLGYRRLK